MSFPTGAAEGWGPRVLLCSLRVAQTHLDDGARGPRTLGQCHPEEWGLLAGSHGARPGGSKDSSHDDCVTFVLLAHFLCFPLWVHPL